MQIVRVGALDGGILEIQMRNDSTILLNTALLLDDPVFAPLAEDDRILYPHTDGAYLYWHNGPIISIDDVLALLKK